MSLAAMPTWVLKRPAKKIDNVSIMSAREVRLPLHATVLFETLGETSLRGFSRADIAQILEVADTYQELLLDAWEAHFGEEE